MAKTITRLPEPPTTAEPQNFDDRADAFVAAFNPFREEANSLAEEAEANAQRSEDANTTAQSAKESAQASAQTASEAKEAAARSASEAVSAKEIAVSAAASAKQSEQVATSVKEGLQDSANALEEIKKIINDGFIDDTKTRTNLTYSSKKIDSDFSKTDHNHDTTYLSIEKFNEFKTKIVKKQNNLDFMVNFLQDVTADGVAVKIDDTSNSSGSFVQNGKPVLCVDNGKYFYIGTIGSNYAIISDEIKNPNGKNILKRHQYLTPYSSVAFLYKIGDLLYFSRDTSFFVYNTKTEEWVEANSSMGDSLYQMERMHFIDPKFAVTRHPSGLKIKGANGGNYITLDYISNTAIIMQDYLIEMNDSSKTVKAYKIVVEGGNVSKRPIDISQVPYHDSHIKLVAADLRYYDIRTKYYKKDDDLYYLENFENDDGMSRSYALYKNKERLPIPIMPQGNEKLFLAQRTRFLINVYIGADQTYTRMYDITGKGKIVRLPVGVLCAEETEQGVRIAYVTRLPAGGKPRTFYETVLPYGIFSNEE